MTQAKHEYILLFKTRAIADEGPAPPAAPPLPAPGGRRCGGLGARFSRCPKTHRCPREIHGRVVSNMRILSFPCQFLLIFQFLYCRGFHSGKSVQCPPSQRGSQTRHRHREPAARGREGGRTGGSGKAAVVSPRRGTAVKGQVDFLPLAR